MSSKSVQVDLPGSSAGARSVDVTPGMKTRDVLRTLGLGDDFDLEAPDGKRILGKNEDVYPLIPSSGARISGAPRMDVGFLVS